MKRKNINILLSKPYIHTPFCLKITVHSRRIVGGQVFKRQKYRTIRTHGVIFFCIFAEYNPASAKAQTQHPATVPQLNKNLINNTQTPDTQSEKTKS